MFLLVFVCGRSFERCTLAFSFCNLKEEEGELAGGASRRLGERGLWWQLAGISYLLAPLESFDDETYFWKCYFIRFWIFSSSSMSMLVMAFDINDDLSDIWSLFVDLAFVWLELTMNFGICLLFSSLLTFSSSLNAMMMNSSEMLPLLLIWLWVC